MHKHLFILCSKAVFVRMVLIVFFLVAGVCCFAQDKVEMADTMRSNGKIYVVVAVCLTILIGLFIYVFALDRKMTRMEKNKD